MKKVSERPAELTRKVARKKGFDLRLDLRNGKLNKRDTVYAIPCREVDMTEGEAPRGYKKLELSTGHIVYHKNSTVPDKLVDKRVYNTLKIDRYTLKFVQMHSGAVSRLLYNCETDLLLVKELMPKSVQPIFNWTEWHMYRSPQKTLRVRNYNHERFQSEHAKTISEVAATA